MAGTDTALEKEIAYEETIRLKPATDFGMDMPPALFGGQPMPLEGVRLDRIAFFADGVVLVDGSLAQLRENVTLHTAAARHA